MLIVFPLGLLGTSVVFDIVRLATNNPSHAMITYYMLLAGLIGGALAAVFGLIDYLGIPSNTRAKRGGALHGIGNVVVMGLFAGSFLIRHYVDLTSTGAFAMSVGGLLLALVTGWLGGELVDRLGVGVDSGAHVNAPSSLSDRPVTDVAR